MFDWRLMAPGLLAAVLAVQFVWPDGMFWLRNGREPEEDEAPGMRLWTRSLSLAGALLLVLAVAAVR